MGFGKLVVFKWLILKSFSFGQDILIWKGIFGLFFEVQRAGLSEIYL